MNLRWRPVTIARLQPRVLATGIALGVLAALLLAQLGVIEIFGLHGFGPYLTTVVGLSVAVAVFGGGALLVAADALVLAVYLIVAFTPIVRGPVERWVRNDTLPSRVDAVVALSGFVNADSTLQPEAAERLLTAVELVQ